MMPRDLYDMGEVGEDITFEKTITLIKNDVDDEFVTISHVENQFQGDANICLVVHLTKLVEYHFLTLVQVVMPPKAKCLKTFIPPLVPNQQPHIPLMAPTQQPHIPPMTPIPQLRIPSKAPTQEPHIPLMAPTQQPHTPPKVPT
ncbi:hypothetical protein CR513_10790, partial [Mucuna pruriens]